MMRNLEGRSSPTSRNNKRRTKHSLRDEEPCILLGSRPEAKENQRQVKEPIRTSQASMESSLERPLKLFYHNITLRVKTGSSRLRNSQRGTDSCPDGGRELCSMK